MSLFSSYERDELCKVLEFRCFIRENHLKGQSAFLLLKEVETIFDKYLFLVKQIRLNTTVSKSEENPIKQFLDIPKWIVDGGRIHQRMSILPFDDRNKIIKIADVLRGVTTDNLLNEVEDIIDSYLVELRTVTQRLQ